MANFVHSSFRTNPALGSGGARKDHNFFIFGPILIIFGIQAKLAIRKTPNRYDTAMTVFGQRLHRA